MHIKSRGLSFSSKDVEEINLSFCLEREVLFVHLHHNLNLYQPLWFPIFLLVRSYDVNIVLSLMVQYLYAETLGVFCSYLREKFPQEWIFKRIIMTSRQLAKLLWVSELRVPCWYNQLIRRNVPCTIEVSSLFQSYNSTLHRAQHSLNRTRKVTNITCTLTHPVFKRVHFGWLKKTSSLAGNLYLLCFKHMLQTALEELPSLLRIIK